MSDAARHSCAGGRGVVRTRRLSVLGGEQGLAEQSQLASLSRPKVRNGDVLDS